MTAIVFDSSVLIALLNREPGWQTGEQHLSVAVVSAVNMAEVATFFGRKQASDDAINRIIHSLKVQVLPFDISLVTLAAGLQRDYPSLGLSLGDRACIATAMRHQLPILTADRIWAKVAVGTPVQILR